MLSLFTRSLALAALAGALPAVAAAHDFWIQPDDFCVSPGAAAPFTLQVGHGADRQRSAIPASRILRFETASAGGEPGDARNRLHLGGPTADGSIRIDETGPHQWVLETDHRAQSHLPAARFEAYLAEEGLTPAIEWRRHAARTNTAGSETYGRVAKALVRAGGAAGSVFGPAGLTLEIVAEADPYQADRATDLPFRVYYRGSPLAGATVKLTDLDDDAHPRQVSLTDGEGRVSFAIPRTGQWQLNVVWTRLLSPDSETEFETTFSSLAFGCRG